MPKYTKDISGYWTVAGRNQTTLDLTGTTSVVTALTDDSDTTYGKAHTYSRPIDLVTLWPSLGSGERIVAVCPSVRSKRPGSKTVTAKVGVLVIDAESGRANIYEGVSLGLTYQATAQDSALDAHQGQQKLPVYGYEWDLDVILMDSFISNARPVIILRDPHTAADNRAWWYEAALDFYATEAADVDSVSAPSGTVATTQRPTLGTTIEQIVESWQVPAGLSSFMCGVTVEWSLYSGTHTTPPDSSYLITSFETQETIDTYGDGVTPTQLAVTADTPVPLPNGSYTLFVRVRREHPAGDPWKTAWSSYSYRQFAINVPVPTAPSLSLSSSDANQRISVTVNAPATTGYDTSTYQVHVQRQLVDDTWRDVRGMVGIAHEVGSAILIGYDYEAERAETNTYRARVSAWHTADAVRRYSTWDTETVTGPAVNGWNLKTVDDPASSWMGAHIALDPSEESQRPAAVFEPSDRERPVVVYGSVAGYRGSLPVWAEGATAVAALQALVDYAGTVLLEEAFGGAKHIAITKASWTKQGDAADPLLVGSLEYVEVDAGLDVDET